MHIHTRQSTPSVRMEAAMSRILLTANPIIIRHQQLHPSMSIMLSRLCLTLSLLLCTSSASGVCRLASTTSLDCSSLRLRSLSPLSSWRTSALLELDLSSNALSVLDVSELEVWQRLRVASFSMNNIHVLEGFDAMRHPLVDLFRLDLSHNRLHVLPPRLMLVLPSLRTLNVSHNALHTMGELALHLPLLETLDVASNRLQEVSLDVLLRMLPNLLELDVSSNALWRLDSVSFVPASFHLELLDLSANELRVVEEHALLSLNVSHLDLSSNMLKSLDFLTHLGHIRTLVLDGNPFDMLSKQALNNVQVEFLSISHMPNLRMIDDQALYKLHQLRTLTLAHNPKLAFVHSGALDQTEAVRAIDLSHDHLQVLQPQLVAHLDPDRLSVSVQGNPLACHTVNQWLVTFGALASCPSSSTSTSTSTSTMATGPLVAALFDSRVTLRVGDRVSFRCDGINAADTWWTDNTGSVIRALCANDQGESKRVCVTREQELKVNFVVNEDNGLYSCHALPLTHQQEEEGEPNSKLLTVTRNVTLHVERLSVRIFALSVDADAVVVGWHADEALGPRRHLLIRVLLVGQGGGDEEPVEVRRARPIDIGQTVHSFAIHSLSPSSSYIFELCVHRPPFTARLASVSVTTAKMESEVQQTDYVALIAVFCLLSIVTGSCVIVLGLRVCQVIATGADIFADNIEPDDKIGLAASFSYNSDFSSKSHRTKSKEDKESKSNVFVVRKGEGRELEEAALNLVVSVSEQSCLMDFELATPIDDWPSVCLGNENKTDDFGVSNASGNDMGNKGSGQADLVKTRRS